MLITKTVIMKWNNRNKSWYESKGYKWTKNGDEFKVKVEDLPDNTSKIYVNVACDCPDCTTPITKPIIWQAYKRYVHKDGKYYCNNCANRLFVNKSRIKTNLKDGKNSFGYWLIKNLSLRKAIEIINRWDDEKNNKDIREVNYSSHGLSNKLQGYWFKCPKGTHASELKSVSRFTQNYGGELNCTACNSIGQYLIDTYGEDALNKYWDYEKNNELGLDPFQITKNNHIKVWIFCHEKSYHGSYDIQCANFYKGDRCGYCKGTKVHYLDSLGYLYPQVIPIWSEKNEKSPYEYMPNSGQYIWWKCLDGKHQDYKRSINNSNVKKFRCPECVQEMDESVIQNKARLYLEFLKYDVLHEYDCTIVPINPRTKYQLPFDNEIKLISGERLICEVNGIQHYQELPKNHPWLNGLTSKEYLHYQKLKDRYKRFIAYKNGYEYLEIPYWVFDDKESYKVLINNKIKGVFIDELQ